MLSTNHKIILITAVFSFSWIEAIPTRATDGGDLSVNLRNKRASHICAENAYFSEKVPDCEASCKNPHPVICINIGSDGCLCREGYIRNSSYACIKIEDCPVSKIPKIDAKNGQLSNQEIEKILLVIFRTSRHSPANNTIY